MQVKPVSYNEKLLRICQFLGARITIMDNSYAERDMPVEERIYRIKRWNLKNLVIKALNVTSANAICNWINTLKAENIIAPNPTSQLTPKKVGRERHIKPSNDTKYFLDKELIFKWVNQNRNQTNLFSFSKVAMPSKGNNGNLSE